MRSLELQAHLTRLSSPAMCIAEDNVVTGVVNFGFGSMVSSWVKPLMYAFESNLTFWSPPLSSFRAGRGKTSPGAKGRCALGTTACFFRPVSKCEREYGHLQCRDAETARCGPLQVPVYFGPLRNLSTSVLHAAPPRCPWATREGQAREGRGAGCGKDVAEDLLGTAEDGGAKVFIVASATFQRQNSRPTHACRPASASGDAAQSAYMFINYPDSKLGNAATAMAVAIWK